MIRDIRFWLFLLAAIRLYAITLPPVEFQHAWRQTDGLMIARNFYETDANIFYPRVDIAGEKTGITGSEFPIFNYLIYLVSNAFGYADWYGRLIVLIVSTLGCLYFYKLIRKFFNETVAFNSTILLTCSYWFCYSRKIFPDCFAASLCLIGFYFAIEFLEKQKWHYLALYFFLGTLGSLSKISAAVILSAMIIPMMSNQYPMSRKLWAAGVSGGIILSIVGWYFVWVPYLNQTFGFGDHFTSGCPLLSMGWEEIKANWKAVLWRLYILPFKYVGFVVFLASFLYVVIKKQWLFFALFIIPYSFFMLIILKTGKNIVADQYYILVIIPAMALMSGFGLSKIPNEKIMLLLLIIIASENIGDQVNEFRVHRINEAFLKLEAVVDKISDKDDLFVINSGPHCPTAMYFAHRKGWTTRPNQLLDDTYLSELRSKGCKFVLICKKMYGENYDIVLELPQVVETPDFRVYALN